MEPHLSCKRWRQSSLAHPKSPPGKSAAAPRVGRGARRTESGWWPRALLRRDAHEISSPAAGVRPESDLVHSPQIQLRPHLSLTCSPSLGLRPCAVLRAPARRGSAARGRRDLCPSQQRWRPRPRAAALHITRPANGCALANCRQISATSEALRGLLRCPCP
jgi:hypothetical protein